MPVVCQKHSRPMTQTGNGALQMKIFTIRFAFSKNSRHMVLFPKFAKYSSIVITLQFQSCAKLDQFMEKYASGEIQSLIQSIIVTKRFLNLLGLSRVDLQVSISDENYKNYNKEIKTGLCSLQYNY